MTLHDKSWSENNPKESLFKEVDDEKLKIYQIISKYSSEKFSALATILVPVGIIFALYQNYILNLPHSDFFQFYLITACLLILFWTYAESVSKYLKKFLKIPIIHDYEGEQNPIDNNLLNIFHFSERMQLRYLLQWDWQFAKKSEPHFRSFSIFLISIICISYANIRGWIDIPNLNAQLPLGIWVSWALIAFSSIIIVSMLKPNIMTSFWENVFKFPEVLAKNNKKKGKTIIFGVILIAIGILLSIFWTIIFNIFPLILLYYFVAPNIPFLITNFPDNLLILALFLIILNYLIEIIALIFGINLVEKILNEKIWWLEKLKMELSKQSDDTLENACRKLKFSDLYVPIPIQCYFVFQKYVLFPNWLSKKWIDMEHCDELDFEMLKERFQSHNMTLYEKRPFLKKDP